MSDKRRTLLFICYMFGWAFLSIALTKIFGFGESNTSLTYNIFLLIIGLTLSCVVCVYSDEPFLHTCLKLLIQGSYVLLISYIFHALSIILISEWMSDKFVQGLTIGSASAIIGYIAYLFQQSKWLNTDA